MIKREYGTIPGSLHPSGLKEICQIRCPFLSKNSHKRFDYKCLFLNKELECSHSTKYFIRSLC